MLAAWIGFDWGDAEHAFVLQDQAGHRQRDKIPHSAENLHGWLKQIGQRYGGRSVVMAIEASRGAVIHALLQYPWLSIYPINPVTSARYRKAFRPSGAKDDLPDAEVLLDLVRHHADKLRPLEPQDPLTLKLACLVEARRALITQALTLTTEDARVSVAILQLFQLLDQVEVFQKHVALFDAQIKTVFASHPEAAFFRELPVAGPQLAPRLCVAFSASYADPASLQKITGVAPVREKSGNQIWTHWRWGAPIFLRQTFIEWAGQTVRYSPWAKVYYQHMLKKGKKHAAIIRSLAFKWIRVLWKCRQAKTPYNEACYLQQLIHRKSPHTL